MPKVFGAFLVILVVGGCESLTESGEEPKFVINDLKTHHSERQPWNSLEPRDGDDRFQFLVVADRTGGMREGVFEEATDRLELLQPAFIMSVGDLIEGYDYPRGYLEDKAALNAEWDRFDQIVDKIDAPFFYTPGDHDFSSRLMADVWEERLGRSYYHFIYKDTLFLVLNSELFHRPSRAWHWKIDEQIFADEQIAQLEYIGRVLNETENVRWTFVFMHKPFWRELWVRPQQGEPVPESGPWARDLSIPPEWPPFEKMLSQRNYTLFAGHLHTYEYVGERTIEGYSHDKISLATTGGLSGLRGLEYGEFDHFLWVTMTEDGPVIANVLPSGLQPVDVPTPKQRPYWVE